jgi:hypothetical protein
MSLQLFIYAISHSTIAIDKIFQESTTIITLIIQMIRRVIIVTSLIVGALILALMLWMKPVVGVDEVEVFLGFGAGITDYPISPQTSQVMWESMVLSVSWALTFS